MIKIRAYLTNFYTKRWLYSLAYLNETEECDNPDERISNDIKQFITTLKALFLGFVGSVLTFSFSLGYFGIFLGVLALYCMVLRLTFMAIYFG